VKEPYWADSADMEIFPASSLRLEMVLTLEPFFRANDNDFKGQISPGTHILGKTHCHHYHHHYFLLRIAPVKMKVRVG
jgi:hypothetical protein